MTSLVADGKFLTFVNARKHPYWLACIVFVVLFGVNVALQSGFIQWSSIQSNITSYLPLMILAIGQTYVILGGSVDLSIGAIVSLVNVVTVRVIEMYGGSVLGVLMGMGLGLLAGLGAGLLNGFAVGWLRLQPIVATFATSIIFGGLALYVMPQAGGALPDFYSEIYSNDFLGVPVPILILIFVLVLTTIISKTRFYTHLLATGGNSQAAYQTGLPVISIRIRSHAITGIAAAVATFCILGETASGDPLLGPAFTLSSVSAVVLGGTALSGGFGSIAGSVIGAATLGLINSLIFFSQLVYYLQPLVQGLIILAALAGGVFVSRRK
jgi:ribose transport system permease protein